MSSEILFKSPLGMIERMNYPVENQINKDICFDRLSIPDMELLEKTKAVARSMFGTGLISDLDARQRVELAKRVKGTGKKMDSNAPVPRKQKGTGKNSM